MTRPVALTSVSVAGRVRAARFDGAGVVDTESARMLRVGTVMTSWKTTSEMCLTDVDSGKTFAVTVPLCTLMRSADKRVRHSVVKRCLLTASSLSALAMMGAISFVVLLWGGTEFGKCRSPNTGRLAGVLLTVG